MVCHAFGDRSDPCEASRHQHHASCDTSLPAKAKVAGDDSTTDLANVAKKAASADNKDGNLHAQPALPDCPSTGYPISKLNQINQQSQTVVSSRPCRLVTSFPSYCFSPISKSNQINQQSQTVYPQPSSVTSCDCPACLADWLVSRSR